MDIIQKKALDKIINVVNKKNDDWVNVTVGREGKGKTDFSIQCCAYMDPNYSKENLVINPEEFIKKVMDPKLKVIHVLEGASTFYVGDIMSKTGKNNVKMLSMCRKLNKIIWIDTPSIFIINWYLRRHRVRSLKRVVKRGWVWCYNGKNLRNLLTNCLDDRRRIVFWKQSKYNFRDDWKKIKDPYLQEIYDYAEEKKLKEGIMDTLEKPKKVLKCKDCGYTWEPKTNKTPKRCPNRKCQSWNWDRDDIVR